MMNKATYLITYVNKTTKHIKRHNCNIILKMQTNKINHYISYATSFSIYYNYDTNIKYNKIKTGNKDDNLIPSIKENFFSIIN